MKNAKTRANTISCPNTLSWAISSKGPTRFPTLCSMPCSRGTRTRMWLLSPSSQRMAVINREISARLR